MLDNVVPLLGGGGGGVDSRVSNSMIQTAPYQVAVYHDTTLVSIILSICFLVVGPFRIWWLHSRRRPISDRVLTIPKQVSFGLFIACQVALAVLWTRTQHVNLPDSTAAAIAAGVAAAGGLTMLYLSSLEDVRSLRPSYIMVVYLLLLILSDLTRACTLWVISDDRTLNALLTVATVLEAALFLLESVEHSGREDIKRERYNRPETFSGFANRAIFLWPSRLFMIGARGRIEPGHLFALDQQMTSAHLHKAFTARYRQHRPKSSCRALRTLAVVLWKPLILTVIPRLMMVALNVTQPVLTDRLLQYLSAAGVESPASEGRGIIGAYTLQYVGLAVFTGLYWQCHVRVLAMVRGCLISSLNEKILSADPTLLASPQASMTLMSTDIQQMTLGFMRFHDLWGNSLQAALAAYLLARQVGIACVYPVVLVLTCAIISISISSWANTRQKAWMKAIETRIGVTSSLLSSAKGLKMRGLLIKATDRIMNLRKLELQRANRFRRTIVCSFILAYIPQYLGPALTFLAFILQAQARGEAFDAPRAFTSLATLLILTQPLASTIQGIPLFAAACGSCSRIDAFLATPDLVDIRDFPLESNTPSKSESSASSKEDIELPTRMTAPAINSPVAFQIADADLGWNTKSAILHKINLTIPKGRLTCVVGPVACGKSTLCRALIGEGSLLGGSVQMYASPADVAYVDQVPWLINDTIKRNIIGFSDVDEKWYDAVLEACGLLQDIDDMPLKSETIVGNEGSALSGGQRQRVSLARTIYSRKSILIIDDVLSGLDARTARHVFYHAIGPAGIAGQQGATIVFASHSTPFLSLAGHVVVIGRDGQIAQEGAYEDLVGAVKEQLNEQDELQNSADDPNAALPQVEQTSDDVPAPLAAALEDRYMYDKSTYSYYFKTAGAFLVTRLLTISAVQTGLNVGSTYWLGYWTEKIRPDSMMYWGIYCAMQALALIFLSVTVYQILITMITRTGITVHRRLINTVRSARLPFLSARDGGKTLNHFSQDIELMDRDLPFSFSDALISAMTFTGQSLLIVVIFPWSAFIMVGCFGIVYVLQKVYLRTSRQLRLLDLEAKSPLYSNYMSILRGGSTIRAYGWTKHNFDLVQSLLDRSQQPAYLLLIVQQWLNFVLEVIVACIAVVVVIIAVMVQSLPGNTGVVLTQVMSIGLMLQYATRAWTLFETSLAAVARVKQFEEQTPSEARPDAIDPAAEWPTEGRVELRNISAAYRLEDESDALKNITITVQPGEWIGICGKSGSGKSSFLQALLQLLEIKQGRIVIDGVCLDEVEPDVVRKRINTIPQDPTYIPGPVRLNLDPYEQHSDEELVTALGKVNLGHLVDSKLALSEPFDSSSLSSGQRQLFALATAILAKSTIVLVDEATSQVDAETEAVMQEVLRSEFSSSTVFAIAHRLEGLLDYSRILVLGDGKVLEFDTPQALLARDSHFKTMFAATGKKH